MDCSTKEVTSSSNQLRSMSNAQGFYISGARGSYFNQRSSFKCCVLALYQGTTLVVPHRSEKELGFSPCLLLPGKAKTQGLKAQIFVGGLNGPTKLVP